MTVTIPRTMPETTLADPFESAATILRNHQKFLQERSDDLRQENRVSAMAISHNEQTLKDIAVKQNHIDQALRHLTAED